MSSARDLPENPGVLRAPDAAEISEPSSKKYSAAGDTTASAAMTESAEQEASDLAAARGGDDAAFARLYDRLAPVVLSLCRRRSLAEAEDAMQETFIRAHRLLHKVHDPQRLRPWVYGIARRVCSERIRAARRRRRHEEQAAVSTSARPSARAENPGPAAEPAAGPEQAEQLELLGEALSELDDRERLAIHLYYLETDPLRAAGSALGLSRSGYYKLLARARQRLATILKERQ